MDSRAWLIGLAAITAALASLLVVDLLRAPDGSPSRRIVPEWDARTVRSIRLERAGQPSLILERGSGSEPGANWSLRMGQSPSLPVDPSALRALLGTIEILTAIRREPGRVSEPRLLLTVEQDGRPPIRLLLPAPGPGPTDRVWIGREGEDDRLLIDGYAARALDVGPDDLRERRPFRGRLDGASRLEIAVAAREVALRGPPWQVELPGGAASAAQDRVHDLLEWCRQLRIDEFLAPDDPPRRGESLARVAVYGRAGRSEIVYRGTCADGSPLVDTPVGRGCLPAASGPSRLVADAEAWIDRRLVRAPIDSVLRLRLAAGERAIEVDRAANPDVLRGWLLEWRDAAAGPLAPADRASAPVATVDFDIDGGGRERASIIRTANGALAARRDGEPVALLLRPEAAAHLDPAPHRFRSLDLLTAEPTDLAAATARRGARIVEAIERGQTLEEWRALAPPGARARAAAIESLRQSVGFLRAERFAAARAEPRHGLSVPRRTVELTFDPRPGSARAAESVRHTIEIGSPTADKGCHARLDRDPAVFELSAARCAALLGPWTH